MKLQQKTRGTMQIFESLSGFYNRFNTKQTQAHLTIQITLLLLTAALLLTPMVSVTAQTNPPADEEMIDLGESPLSDDDMNKVMNWIAVKTGAEKLPFCWKQSFGRGAGEPLSGKCANGLEQNGALCYPQCQSGYGGAGPVCWKQCPSGFTDIGAFCQKPAAYGRGAGYVIWDEAKCNRENSQGCEKNGALWYPKCQAGFYAVGCCVCSPVCPTGYTDTGTGCTKPSYGRGAGEPFACRPGTEKDGALCYSPCGKADFVGGGPVCWQKCPSQQSWDCGAACSTNQKECAFAVVSMVTAPIIAAVNIATLGSASAATSAAKATQVATSVSKLTKAVDTVKKAMTTAKVSVETIVGGADKLAKIQKVGSVGWKTFVASTAVGKEIDKYSKEFADNFEDFTSGEISREINQRFGKEAAYQIKRQWGIRHLTMNLEANGFSTAKNVMTLIGIADPTGLVSVVNAFLHPVCKADTPFPTVTARYNR